MEGWDECIVFVENSKVYVVYCILFWILVWLHLSRYKRKIELNALYCRILWCIYYFEYFFWVVVVVNNSQNHSAFITLEMEGRVALNTVCEVNTVYYF